MMTWIKRIALALAVVVVAWVAVGTWYVGKVGQREETWHDEAIANSQPASEADWHAAARRDNPVIELRLKSGPRALYLARIYDDGGYVSALHPGSSDLPPLRIETGRIAPADSRELRERADALYAVHEDAIQSANPLNPADARLTLVHDGGRRVLYRYRTSEFASIAPALRDFDARLFEAMQPWSVRPAHGYARPVPALSYNTASIPSLVRGLESPREDLHASVVSRLVDIGRPALPELTRVLREGAAARYLPVSRYLAVVDGIGRLAEPSDAGFALVRSLAVGPASTPTQRALRKQAMQVVKRYESGTGSPR